VSGALIMRDTEGGRSRGPAFLPADLRPEPQGGLYQGLYKRLRGFILDGIWLPGTRLPSSRALAADLNVSRNTAILAVEQLIADGWAESRSRSGVYVSAASCVTPLSPGSDQCAAPAELPPFALQRPATDLFPAQIWKQLQARAWSEIEPHRLLSADLAGDPGLREAIARLVCAPRGLRCHPDQVLIVPSATLAIDLVAAALVRPGDRTVVEDPCRPAIRQLLCARGAELAHVAVAAGWELETLPREARLACVAPTVQFPTCTTLDEIGRTRLLGWARETGAWLLEDDRDAEAWFGQAAAPLPLAADAPDRVILVGSFNRLLFPGLCVAFLIAPPPLVERLRAAHATIGGRASLASQLTLREFIAEGHFARHLRRRRQAYAERRQALIEIAGIPHVNGAGLHLAMPVSESGAVAAAEQLGGVATGRFRDAPDASGPVLLGLGLTPDQIRFHAPRIAVALSSFDPHGER